MTGLRTTLSFSIIEDYCTASLVRLQRIRFAFSSRGISSHRMIQLVLTKRMSRNGRERSIWLTKRSFLPCRRYTTLWPVRIQTLHGFRQRRFSSSPAFSFIVQDSVSNHLQPIISTASIPFHSLRIFVPVIAYPLLSLPLLPALLFLKSPRRARPHVVASIHSSLQSIVFRIRSVSWDVGTFMVIPRVPDVIYKEES